MPPAHARARTPGRGPSRAFQGPQAASRGRRATRSKPARPGARRPHQRPRGLRFQSRQPKAPPPGAQRAAGPPAPARPPGTARKTLPKPAFGAPSPNSKATTSGLPECSTRSATPQPLQRSGESRRAASPNRPEPTVGLVWMRLGRSRPHSATAGARPNASWRRDSARPELRHGPLEMSHRGLDHGGSRTGDDRHERNRTR